MRFFNQFALAGVSALALAVPAFAQDNPAAEPDNAAVEEGLGTAGGDIVVTARRRDESLQDVPLTVNAVTSEAIEKLNIRDFKDIAAVVPGLVLTPGNRTTGSVSSIRGTAVDNTSSGNNGTVEYYLNDAPVSGGVVLQSLFDVGQIEVLRGPQGTLRGRASPSGSITITTRRPDMNEIGGYVMGTVTTIGGINAQGAVNVPIIPDLLAVRVAGVVDDNEGTRVRSVNNPSLESSNKTRGVRVSVRLQPTSNIDINASYGHLVKNSIVWDQVESTNLATGAALPAGSTLITARDRLAVADVANVNHMAFDMFNWQAQWAFAGQRLNYVGSYTKQDLRSTEPQDKGNFFGSAYPGNSGLSNNNDTYTTPAATLNLQNAAQATHSYPRQETHELRLSSEERLFGAVDYILGGFVSKLIPWTDLVAITSFNFTGTPAVVSPATFGSISTRPTARRGRTLERAAFGNVTVHLGEQTEVSGGLRYINYQENLNGANNTFNAWIWTASAKHRFNEDLMVYASAGSSFRVGSGTNGLILNSRGITTAAVTDPFLLSLFPITPERSKSYEIGLRSNWFDRKVLFNLSAFHQDFSNYIFSVPAGTFSVNVNGTTIQVPSAIAVPVPVKVDGIEAEFGFRPNDHLSLNASLAYAKSKMNATIPCGTPAAGQQIATCAVSQSAGRTSPFSATVQGEYIRPVTGSLNGFVRGLLSIQGNSLNDPTNPYDNVDAYALLNLYAGVRAEDGSWEVFAYGKNITNTFRVTDRGLTGAALTTNAGPRFADYRLISTTDPREFGLTARFSFGSR